MEKENPKIDQMDLSDVLMVCADQVIDNRFSLEKARSPKTKRSIKHALKFWANAHYYLSLVEVMTDDEFLAFEQRAKKAKEKEVSNG